MLHELLHGLLGFGGVQLPRELMWEESVDVGWYILSVLRRLHLDVRLLVLVDHLRLKMLSLVRELLHLKL